MILFLATKHVDLSPQPGIKPRTPCTGRLSLSHWTCREVPRRPWVLLKLQVKSAGSAPSLLPGSASPLQRLSVLLCPLCSVAELSRVFPLCNCCPDQLHPLHLQQWTEQGINHIFWEGHSAIHLPDTSSAVTGACPQSGDWWLLYPAPLPFPCPLRWLAVQHWSCVLFNQT